MERGGDRDRDLRYCAVRAVVEEDYDIVYDSVDRYFCCGKGSHQNMRSPNHCRWRRRKFVLGREREKARNWWWWWILTVIHFTKHDFDNTALCTSTVPWHWWKTPTYSDPAPASVSRHWSWLLPGRNFHWWNHRQWSKVEEVEGEKNPDSTRGWEDLHELRRNLCKQCEIVPRQTHPKVSYHFSSINLISSAALILPYMEYWIGTTPPTLRTGYQRQQCVHG